MRSVVILLIILSATSNINAQQLLANGSLNERNLCTEFRALCAPEAWFFIPTYVLPSPKEDSNYYEVLSMGSLAKVFPPGKRNFFYTKILCKLQAGKQYKFSVWVKTADNKFDHLDIWFGAYEPRELGLLRNPVDPSFTITPEHQDSLKPGWKKYSYVYTANGEEQFIMIGNFSKEGMDKKKVVSLSQSRWVMYGIDDISLSAVDSTTVCPEYIAVSKQVYDQNRRHPAGLIEERGLDPTLIVKDPTRKKEITWVIVDTPPSLEKKLSDTLIIPDVLFHFNSSTLNPAFTKDLENIIEKLKDRQFTGLEVTGHTDNKGTSSYNLQLSERRAKAIKDYLVKKLSLNAEAVTIRGMGEKIAIATNETTEGRQKNRRVEIVLKH